MRLNRLDLTRYGRFTNRVLDFGTPAAGQADLHILYGPNEAGKSTALAAFLDLLYGIPAQSRYSYLHSYPNMRVGALLQIGGAVLEVARIKRATGTLLDAQDRPLPDSALQGVLSGVDRAGYEAMFSLDDETLERGGESILASQGELGQMIFSASAGLADMSLRLDGLRREAEGFRSATGRKGRLAELKTELDAIEKTRREIDTAARTYSTLVDQEARAEAGWRKAQAAQATAMVGADQVRRLLAALPASGRLSAARTAAEALAGLPEPPAGWAEALPGLIATATGGQARLAEATAQMDVLEQRSAALVPDVAVLDLSPAITAAAQVRSGFDEALKDLPKRQEEAAEAAGLLRDLMQQLGRDGPAERLVLPAPTVARLRSLIAARSGIDARQDSARVEAVRAGQSVAAAEAAITAAGLAPVQQAEALEPLVTRLRARDPVQAVAQAARQVALAEAALAPPMAALAPWRGAAQDLLQQAPPVPDRIAAWARTLDAARLALAETDGRIARAKAGQARLTALQGARAAAPPEQSAGAAVAARAVRERLWAGHRATLSADSADAFETALRMDDRISAALAEAGAAEIAAAAAREAAALAGVEMTEAQAARAAASLAQAETLADIAAAIGALSPELLPMDPATLRDWLVRRERALEVLAGLTDRRATEAAVRAEAAEARAALVAALGQADADAPLETLMAQAEGRVAATARLAGLVAAREAAVQALAARRHDAARAEAAVSAWHDDLAAVCAGTWLAEMAAPDMAAPDPDALSAMLETVGRIAATLTRLRDLEHRISTMQTNRDAFVAAVVKIAGPGDAAALWSALTARLAEAQRVDATRRSTQGLLEEAREKAAALQRAVADTTGQIDRMAAHFGASGLDGVCGAMAGTARRQVLSAEAQAAEHEICAGLTLDLPDALALLQTADRPALEAQEALLRAEASALSTTAQTAFADLSEARRQLAAVGGDDAVARLDERRQTILLDITDQARDHLALRLGILRVDDALRAYRDSHRSAMLARASDAFCTISRGAYTGLGSQMEKEREVLIALSQDGGSKRAADLSKGTRFQLYLALRVAGYHEVARTRPPVPFIADDIMETFDDDRSAEAFQLLSQMAQVGQVIYLTHHKHLCDIARTVCPNVGIQSL